MLFMKYIGIMKKSKITILAGAAVFEAYRLYKGKGIFNKVRFKCQHEAVSNYVESHYPGAFYSDISATGNGWACTIQNNNKNIMLYLSETPEGMFVFWEKEL